MQSIEGLGSGAMPTQTDNGCAPPVKSTSSKSQIPCASDSPVFSPKLLDQYRVMSSASVNPSGRQLPSELSLPTVVLSDGQKVRDYSSDCHFALRMAFMSFDEADGIQALVKKYPDEYPMPAMVKTAAKLGDLLEELLRITLPPSEKRVLVRLREELSALANPPAYSYRPSLLFTYKVLLCKSLLDYRQLVATIDSELLTLDISSSEVRRSIREEMEDQGVRITAYFQPGCTLEQLDGLPWHQLLVCPGLFDCALSELYRSSSLHRAVSYTSGYCGFSSNVPLVPWFGELDIEFFNRTAALPLWLVGCSGELTTEADGLDLLGSAFFEHDLFHLAQRLWFDQRYGRSRQRNLDTVTLIRRLYDHSEAITVVSFRALEVAFFYVHHELGWQLNESMMDSLFELNVPVRDLSDNYLELTQRQVREALIWLYFLDGLGCSEEMLKAKIARLNKEFDTQWVADRFDDQCTFVLDRTKSRKNTPQGSQLSCDTLEGVVEKVSVSPRCEATVPGCELHDSEQSGDDDLYC